jgi:putative SOS response-associated peptidase YedK
MYGRFASVAEKKKMEKEFSVKIGDDNLNAPRFNVAPTQMIAAIAEIESLRGISSFRWGLIPSWAKDDSIGNKLINARAETLREKPSFREAFRSRRCIIPASGFFEWQKTSKGVKQPFYFYLKDKEVFGFAGLWEEWLDMQTGELTETCTIITTEANEVLKPVHERMPVILKDSDYDFWLDEKIKDTSKLQNLLVPFPAREMDSHAVSRSVNNPSANSEELITPLNSL